MKQASSVVGTCVLGAAVFAGVLLLREHGHLTGLACLIVATLAALSLPTSPHLSGRILLTGTAVLGWTQVVWWTPLEIDRVSVLLAGLVASAAAVVGYRLWGPGPHDWSVLPRVRWVDTFPCLVFLAGLASVSNAFRHTRPNEVLAHLLPAWDNAGHFWMFTMILRHGATVDALPPPSSGGTWHYSYYPQGFHATVASVAELIWPHPSWNRDDLLATYWPASALVVLAGVTVLTAGLTSLPTMRDRWDVAAPLVGLLAGAYLFGLGQVLVSWGFASFVFSCTLVGCAFFIALQWTSVRQTFVLLALGGAAVGVAHGWILLLTLMVPMALALFLPLSPARWAAPVVRWVAAVAVVAATAFGVWHAVRIVAGNPDHDLLSTPGAILPPSPWGLLVLLVVVCVVTALTRSPRTTSATQDTPRRRTRVTLLMLPAAMLVATYLGVVQVREHGEVGYYFWKYVCGAELALLVLLVAVVATNVNPDGRLVRGRTVGAALLVTATLTIATTAVGLWMGTGSTGSAAAPHRAPPSTWKSLANELARSTQAREATGASMFVVSPGPLDTMNGTLWYLALGGEWTSSSEAQAEQLQGVHTTAPELADLVTNWLDKNPGSLLVPPDVHALLVTRPEARPNVDRVDSW